MKKVLILTAVIALFIFSCKTSTISLPQGTSETAQLTSEEPVNEQNEKENEEKSDDWLTTDKDFDVPDPKEPEEIAAYEEVHGESSETKAAREQALLEKQEAERIEAERMAAKKAAEAEAERIAAAKKAQDEKAEAERIAAQKSEEEKRAAAIAEKKAKAEQREAERQAAKKAEEERRTKAAAARKAEAERREAERAAAKKAEEERKAKEKAEAQAKAAREKEEKAAKAAKEKEEKAAALAREESERKRKEEERKAEEERILAEAAERRAALERQAAIDAAKTTPAIEDAPYTVENLDKTPSRSVRVLVNQYLDVSYPGAGWVYLGEVDESQNLISFANRELDNSDTCFTLRAIQSGTAVLHFYKQDVLTGTYIDDFLEVVILPQQYKGNEHQQAPLYSEIVPPNQRKYTARKNNTIQNNASKNNETVSQERVEDAEASYNELPQIEDEKTSTTAKAESSERTVNRTIQINESAPDAKASGKKDDAKENASSLPADIKDYTAEQLLIAAKKAYEEKKYNESLSMLNLFFDKATYQLDEGWFLKGQLYESPNAPFRNIRTSRESYQALVDRYPSSPLWKKANNRILYIDRYYFKIR